MMKYELHVHTSECDICAEVDGAKLVRLYKDAGFSGLVITDHYFSLFHEWFKDELIGASHKQIIDRWLKGYYAARNEGEKVGLEVLAGAEVRFDGTINDYLVYGLEAEDFYNLPLLNRLKNLKELVDLLPEHAFIVQAHPFRNDMTVTDPALLSGIEVYNAGTEPYRNQMAKSFAEYYGKKMTSGSDIHRAQVCGKGGICCDKKITNSTELLSVLNEGEYYLIENGEVILQ